MRVMQRVFQIELSAAAHNVLLMTDEVVQRGLGAAVERLERAADVREEPRDDGLGDEEEDVREEVAVARREELDHVRRRGERGRVVERDAEPEVPQDDRVVLIGDAARQRAAGRQRLGAEEDKLEAAVLDEALDALKKDGVRRSGLVLDDPEVIEAMEPGASKRFLPVRLSKTGAPSGDALATAERFGALERYIDQTLGRLAEALRAGSVQADPWFKNARDNACALCDYADACLFDAQNDPMRPVTALKTSEAWERIEHGGI